MIIELLIALVIGVAVGTVTGNDKLLEIKKLELEIEKIRLLKNQEKEVMSKYD